MLIQVNSQNNKSTLWANTGGVDISLDSLSPGVSKGKSPVLPSMNQLSGQQQFCAQPQQQQFNMQSQGFVQQPSGNMISPQQQQQQQQQYYNMQSQQNMMNMANMNLGMSPMRMPTQPGMMRPNMGMNMGMNQNMGQQQMNMGVRMNMQSMGQRPNLMQSSFKAS